MRVQHSAADRGSDLGELDGLDLTPRAYPPDKCEQATITVLGQAELLCRDWAA